MILVTGATGFLGKRVCKKLSASGIEHHRTSLSMGIDLRDAKQCDKLFAQIKPKYVLHCASYVGGIQFGMKYPADIIRNNLLIMINIMGCCQRFQVERLINPISNCAYPGDATLFKETEFWDGALHDSVLFYGMARKISLVCAQAYHTQYQTDTINLILSNMYGPDDHFEEERSHALGALIMKMVSAKKCGEPTVTVWGSGKPVREWLFVDDGAEAMIRACNIEPYHDIINIGVAQGISIQEMAQCIKQTVGYTGELIYDTSKPDGAPYKTVDGSLGAKLFKWEPEMNFLDGLKLTVDWYINNKV